MTAGTATPTETPPPGPGRPARRPRRGSELAWAALGALLTAALTGSSLLGPEVPVAVLGGLVLVLVAASRPKAFALLTMVAIILSTPLQNTLGAAGSYADEGLVALAAVAFSTRRLVTEGRLVWLPGSGWFLGYLAAGLLSAALAEVPAGTAVPAAYIAVKGVVFAFALAQLRWTREDLVSLVRAGITVVVVVALSGAVNLVAPGPWAQLTTGNPPISFLGPVPALNGIFQHPAAFSRFCGVLAVGGLVYGLVVRRSLGNTVLVLLSGGLAFLTLQVKSIVGLLATLGIVGVRFLRPAGVAALVCTLPLAAIVAVPPLVSLIGGDLDLYLTQDSARSLLTQGGVTVAAQYFPFGAGFGRYGSATAATDYSPLYYALGFPGRYGLGPGPDGGQFLNDTQWPAVFGEAGWIGAAFFAAGLVCLAVSLCRRTRADEDVLVRWLRVTGLGWMVLLLVETTAAPVFVSTPSFPFVFAAAGVVASFRRTARDEQVPAVGVLPVEDAEQRPGGRHRWTAPEPAGPSPEH
ncbi:hypothetical protein [Modestobacter versicolor]|uniref:O-antigen ligase domain-containing protein n=1 Tax=Modestobacter versicolor TaxID=429133 RepID=A0A323VDT9_9ACTN|nr:hypothetical protein [Modestobacter versicolor]MBB3676973.1 hypothetical protein [Modestobacter versicolor]PZA22887.1 hypothetical protein DMO24_02810 [Modestobacter versicolor]